MKIGKHDIGIPIILAPMVGITDRPFRSLCRRMGAGLAVSEMVSSNPALKSSIKTKKRLDHSNESSPISVQIVGAEPKEMAEAAIENVDKGAEIIDINMGCPAKKVCNKAAGSALMRDESLVKNILKAVVNAVNVPVTLKMRTGWDINSRNAVQIARIAEDIGIQMLAIHGRTRSDFFKGDAEYSTVTEVKSEVKIPVVANGDINSPAKAIKVIKETNVDAVMIGRGSQGNPWLFSKIKQLLSNGCEQNLINVKEINTVVTQHLIDLYDFYGALRGVRIARKHISWYTKNLPGNSIFIKKLNTLQTCEQQLHSVLVYLSSLDNFQTKIEKQAQ